MRLNVWCVCAVALPLALGGCGGSGEKAPAQTGTTKPADASATPTTQPQAAAEDDEEYELDVIAEAEPDEGAPPLKVQFSASVEEDEGGPWRFEWDFGDGNKSNEQNPTHTFAKVGEYTAVLTVTDQKNNKGTDEIDVFVETDEEGDAAD
jgi:PKD repeat protein